MQEIGGLRGVFDDEKKSGKKHKCMKGERKNTKIILTENPSLKRNALPKK